jgi:PadR family transcriptional regulator PadR
MPGSTEFPPGALTLLVLRILHSGGLHGYAIAQRIRLLTEDVLQVEEGSLYPALQRMLLKGWVAARWGESETGRRVRVYRLTAAGRKRLDEETARHGLVANAIALVLRNA